MPYTKSVAEIVSVLEGEICSKTGGPERVCRGVSTDSRGLAGQELYVARVGSAHDGHDYLEEVANKGASASLVERAWSRAERNRERLWELLAKFPEHTVIEVSDTTRALGTLAKAYRKELRAPVICLTGSNGKTTAKEILRQVLRRLIGKGLANDKSYNNHVGLPLTILRANTDDSWLLLEAGMNHQGELDYLGSIAEPDLAAVLNVGPVHLEYFPSVAAIADAKCELLNHARQDGVWVYRSDDLQIVGALQRLKAAGAKLRREVTFGLEGAQDYLATEIKDQGENGVHFVLRQGTKQVAIELPLFGLHNVANALAAVCIASTQFPTLSLGDIAGVLRDVPNVAMRLEIIQVSGLRIINDAYNANPVSMQAGLQAFRQVLRGESFGIVLGDMLELGRESEKFHREVGQMVAELHPARFLAVGKFAMTMAEAAREAGLAAVSVAGDAAEAARIVVRWKGEGIKTMFLKASRGVGLEKLVEILAKE